MDRCENLAGGAEGTANRQRLTGQLLQIGQIFSAGLKVDINPLQVYQVVNGTI